MSDKNAFFELYRHPKWQEKRLRVMKRDEFTCTECGEKDKTLNVHHGYYEKDLKPWEYDDDTLHTLCEPCHKKAQATYNRIKREIGSLNQYSVRRALAYVCALLAEECPLVTIQVDDFEMALGVADCFGIKPEQVIRALDQNDRIDGFRLTEMQLRRSASRKQGNTT